MGIKKKRLLFLNSITEELITSSESLEVSSIPLIKTTPKKIDFDFEFSLALNMLR